MGMLRLLVGFMTFLVAFGFRRQHAAAWWYGLVLAGSIGGNLIGAALAPWLRSRLREEWILLSSVLGVAGAGVLTFAFSAFRGRPAAALLAGVIGLAAGAAKLAFDSLVQHRVPAVAQGRAFGRFEAGFQLVWVVGSLLPVVISMTLGAGFAVVTVASFVTAVVYLAGIQLARLGRLPPWWPGARREPKPPRRAAVALTHGVGVRGAARPAPPPGTGRGELIPMDPNAPPDPTTPTTPTRRLTPYDDAQPDDRATPTASTAPTPQLAPYDDAQSDDRPAPTRELDTYRGAAPTTEFRRVSRPDLPRNPRPDPPDPGT